MENNLTHTPEAASVNTFKHRLEVRKRNIDEDYLKQGKEANLKANQALNGALHYILDAQSFIFGATSERKDYPAELMKDLKRVYDKLCINKDELLRLLKQVEALTINDVK